MKNEKEIEGIELKVVEGVEGDFSRVKLLKK